VFPIIFNSLKLRGKGPSTTVVLRSDQKSSRCTRITFELWRVAPVADFEAFFLWL
jgi:hypothetical protein